MNITQLIAATIHELLSQAGGTVRIQRNELATKIGCAPSQINYVITSHFTLENGFLVESRRGGGGFIQIVKLDHSKRETIFHIINAIGVTLEEQTARIILQNLVFDQILTSKECKLIMSVLSEHTLKGLSDDDRKTLRATLFKVLLLNLMEA